MYLLVCSRVIYISVLSKWLPNECFQINTIAMIYIYLSMLSNWLPNECFQISTTDRLYTGCVLSNQLLKVCLQINTTDVIYTCMLLIKYNKLLILYVLSNQLLQINARAFSICIIKGQLVWRNYCLYSKCF